MGATQVIGQFISHTPVWVFVLFAILVGLGLQAMRPRVVSPRRMLVMPIVFIVWGLSSLVAKPNFSALIVVVWIATAMLGLALGWSTTRLAGMRIDRSTGLVHLPGSASLLMRVVTVFVVKYAIGAAAAMNPGLASSLAPWDAAVSGLMAGFFAGSYIKFRARYRTAPLFEPEGGIA